MKSPWFRKLNCHWYVERAGKQVRLSKEPDPDGAERKSPPPAVEEAWHKLMREEEPDLLQVGDLFASYIASLPEGDNRTTTRRQLTRFERFIGKELQVCKLRPIKLTEYLRQFPHWRPSSVRTFVNRLHAALNWGVRQGIIAKNPVSSTPGYKREGKNERRRGIISLEDRAKAEDAAAPEFRAVLVALRETGARPSEIARARIEKVCLDGGYMLVPNKTAHQTGEAERKIYLSPAMRTLIEEPMKRGHGFLFLNSKGKPWNIQSLKKRWESLRARTGVKGSLRSYRRTFASNAINQANVNPAIVAELLGHAGLEILMKHYFQADPKAAIEAVRKITEAQSGTLPETAASPPPPRESSPSGPAPRSGSDGCGAPR